MCLVRILSGTDGNPSAATVCIGGFSTEAWALGWRSLKGLVDTCGAKNQKKLKGVQPLENFRNL